MIASISMQTPALLFSRRTAAHDKVISDGGNSFYVDGERFMSRRGAYLAGRVLSGMRYVFGGP